MDISRWNAIMSKFQDLAGYKIGTNQMVNCKRRIVGDKEIYNLNKREERILVYSLRKLYSELKNRYISK
mgnify:FL=1|tara:strand:- start:1493 stop:1699 length:207 start_codon:yes stop_codon:yes gene_type:complete